MSSTVTSPVASLQHAIDYFKANIRVSTGTVGSGLFAKKIENVFSGKDAVDVMLRWQHSKPSANNNNNNTNVNNNNTNTSNATATAATATVEVPKTRIQAVALLNTLIGEGAFYAAQQQLSFEDKVNSYYKLHELKLQPLPTAGKYFIRSLHNGHFFDACGASSKVGTKLIAYTFQYVTEFLLQFM